MIDFRDKHVIMIIVLVVLIIAGMLLVPYSGHKSDEPFSKADKENGEEACQYLEVMNSKGIYPNEISSEELMKSADKVMIIKTPESKKEGITLFNPVSKDYWPNYYYANYSPASDASPDLFNKLYQWTPGFTSTSGWSWWLRPGVAFSPYPRGRWVRNTGSYYYLNNEGMSEPDKRLMPDKYKQEVLKEGYDDINRFRNPGRKVGCCGCAG